ncbi:calphotin-like [Monodelphis domestica]|uniref:calphotin-like n=1 Tax=Monodelphis domestica TaxID=13616 RepID=UPI0000F2E687|nr:calphotin-like [Monodelphis domestica]XP_007507287.1 calphotin-like [Monodelphis domestica]XP_007507288.1 calphotin-like [Monodelphis domestica]XP_007507291.1 calphotin-like [Monodelphis domestica]XP_016282173.1 calphotin-like [Monodelphis domestica]XP_056665680.1 calphotin-like [Monodelphis domestica]XP_056665682.1 calphotin-like [Monodelphis domestica]XP_056665683.1 calphotin-like [Monodelphis domestica]XP_056665684.1 calphotin-like [Monodelphis domestica]
MAFQVPDGSLPPPYIPVVQVPVAAAPPVLPVLAPPPVCCVTPIHPPRWLLTERFQMRALRPRSFSCMCHNPRVAGQGAPRATALSTLEILSQGAAPLRRRGPAPAAARPRGLPSVIAAAQEPLPIGNVATYVPLYDYFYVGAQSYVLPAQVGVIPQVISAPIAVPYVLPAQAVAPPLVLPVPPEAAPQALLGERPSTAIATQEPSQDALGICVPLHVVPGPSVTPQGLVSRNPVSYVASRK